MSKRTERRAAERAAHKANRTQNPTVVNPPAEAQKSQAAAASASTTRTPFNLDYTPEDVANFTDEDLANITDADIEAIMKRSSAFRQPDSPKPTTSEAQINANRENAKSSTGPTSPAGREKVSQNRRTHGLLGRFLLLSEESPADYEDLTQSIYDEYAPQGDTETRLANSVIQHYWLMQRAIRLQEELMHEAHLDQKKLSLFMRYQSTHERSYYKAQKELQNLQKQKSKEQIGFVSQTRQQEAHEARVRLQHATAQRIETDTECRQAMEAPIPGTTRIGFEELTKACANAIAAVVYQNQFKTAAE